ncbi:MAG TPA: hypothetical protein VKO18_14985 [Terriglobia bacterium]|nr:hypothetical protein [Terriglobia bacterium]
MSLIKKPEMTEKKLAANRRNQNLCHTPGTDECRERIRAALLCFGFDTQAEEMAMRALGEDPAHFQKLLERLWEEWNPVGALQEGVVISLGRAMWLMNRAARMQEGYAVRQARQVSSGRENRVHARMMRLKMTAETLRSLARSVGCWHYVTTVEDLDVMKKLHQEGVAGEMGEIAMDLFSQLREPDTDKDGVSTEEKYRGAVNSFRSIFGLEEIKEPVSMLSPTGERIVIRPEGYEEAGASPDAEEDEKSEKDDRYPKITEEDWIARERARKLLRNILSRQAEACEAQRKALLKESVQGPSPYERAAEIAPTHPDARLMRRMQDSNLREVRRLTNLLLKIKRYERQREALEETAPFQDVLETKEVSSLAPECPELLSHSNENS